ncbi:MAG: FecR domain-containing protein [Bdellovibrionia bacterium]
MKNFSRTEKFIFILASLTMGLFSYLMYDDSILFKQTVRSNLEEIGSIVNSKNDVRRKTVTDLSWLPTRNNERVYLQDTIFTGADSETQITLKDGSTLKIAPNSLVKLVKDNGELTLDLKFGQLSANLSSNSNLNLKTGDEINKLITENGNASLVIKKAPGKVDLSLNSGEVSLRSKTGQTKNLQKDNPQLFAKNSNNNPDIELQPTLPVIVKKAEEPVAFSWINKGGPVSKYEIEIAQTPDFNALLTSMSTENLSISVNGLKEPGEYFWRIKPYDKVGIPLEPTSPKNFKISFLSPPEMIQPNSGQILSYEVRPRPNEVPTANVPLKWQKFSEPYDYQLQLSLTANFEKVLLDKTINDTDALTIKMGAGKYFSRIRTIAPQDDTQSEWSAPLYFELQLNRAKGLDAPVLVNKIVEFNKPIENRTPSEDSTPKAKWRPAYNATKYRIEISASPTFEIPQNEETNSLEFAFNNLPPGAKYFRVFALNDAGLISRPSETGVFNLNLAPPNINPIKPLDIKGSSENQTPPPQEVVLSWNPTLTASKYRVELSTQEDFSDSQAFESPSAQVKVKLEKPGTYFVRVQPQDKDNKALTEFSSRQPAVYNYIPVVPAPILKEPLDKATVFLQKAMEPFVWLEWSPDINAANYEIEVATDQAFKNKILTTKTTQTRFLLKDRISLGKIYWRVRGYSAKSNDVSAWSPARQFEIISEKNKAFIE